MLSNQLDSNPPLCVYFVIQQAYSALAARENSAHPLSIAAMSDADALRIRAVAAFYLQQETLAQVALCASYCLLSSLSEIFGPPCLCRSPVVSRPGPSPVFSSHPF